MHALITDAFFALAFAGWAIWCGERSSRIEGVGYGLAAIALAGAAATFACVAANVAMRMDFPGAGQ